MPCITPIAGVFAQTYIAPTAPLDPAHAADITKQGISLAQLFPDSCSAAQPSSMSVFSAERAGAQASSDRGENAEGTSKSYIDKLYDLANWVWGWAFPQSGAHVQDDASQEGSPASGAAQRSESGSRKEMYHFINEMRQMLRNINDKQKDSLEELAHINFDALVMELLKSHITDKKEQAEQTNEQMAKTLQNKRDHNRLLLEKMDELVASGRSSKYWGYLEKASSGLGVAALVAGATTTAGVVILCVGIGLLADQIFDDWGKKKISEWISGEKASQDKHVEYMRLGAGVLTLALFLGSSAKNVILSGASAVTKGSSSIATSWIGHTHSCHRADEAELRSKTGKHDEALKNDHDQLEHVVTAVHEYYKIMSQIAEGRQQAALASMR